MKQSEINRITKARKLVEAVMLLDVAMPENERDKWINAKETLKSIAFNNVNFVLEKLCVEDDT